MIWKNVELHNVDQLIENEDGSISWHRVPESVYHALEAPSGQQMACGSTGVELRFKMIGEKVTIRMAVREGIGCFHVYRGAVQGGFEDHEQHKCVTTVPEDFVISRSEYPDRLRTMSQKMGSEWNSEVVRIIFDRGSFKLFDIIGDIQLPTADDRPSKTLLCYGSSITHGSNAIDASHSWASVLAHELRYDLLNKGMAGSCCMEPAFVDYIADEGQRDHWHLLLLELGINVLHWETDQIYKRVTNTVCTIAETNPNKPIFVLSPFYYCGEDFDRDDRPACWRRIISEVIGKYRYPNVTYLNGLDILGDMTLLSADLIHPSIYGVTQIAERLTAIVKPIADAHRN